MVNPLSRILILLVAAVAIATNTGTPAHAAPGANSTNAPLIKITTYGGFVMPGTDQSNIPSLQISDTGLALWPDPHPHRWDVRYALSQKLDTLKTIKLIAEIARAGEKPAGGWGFPGVADVPNTRIQISTPHMHRTINIYALAFSNGPNLSPAQVVARKRLNSAVNKLIKFASTGAPKDYQPQKYEVWNGMALVAMGDGNTKGPTIGSGLANPASVFCVAMGGTLDIQDTASGQLGMCTLPDGTVVDEWKYFRAEGPKLGQWPSAVKVPTEACTAVSAKAFENELKRKNESGQWLMPGGNVLRLVFRPVFPGEIACAR